MKPILAYCENCGNAPHNGPCGVPLDSPLRWHDIFVECLPGVLIFILSIIPVCGACSSPPDGAVPYATPGQYYNPIITGAPIVDASQVVGPCSEWVQIQNQDGTLTDGEYILPVYKRGVLVPNSCGFAACGTFGLVCN